MNPIIAAILLAVSNVDSACKPSITTASGTHAPKNQMCSGDLIFEDNFDKLDVTKWQHENTLSGGGNWEFQWYTNNRTSSYAENGILKIKPVPSTDQLGDGMLSKMTLDINGASPGDECTNPLRDGCRRTGTPENILNPIKTARIRTYNSFSFCYGRLEIRAKLPTGDWLWPAIWMMSKYNPYGYWPASGEIDLLESRGNKNLVINGVNIGVQQVGTTLHWGPDYPHNQYTKTHKTKNDPKGFNTDYHIYEMLWTNTTITFILDKQEHYSVSPPRGGFWELSQLKNTVANPYVGGTIMAPFDDEFFIIINTAVGGTDGYFPDVPNKPWINASPQAAASFWNGRNSWLPTWNLATDDSAFQIDYVRVYAL